MTHSKNPTLGQKIKFFRLQKHLSQLDLEIKTESSAGSISRFENDVVNPSKETIIKISQTLELNTIESQYILDSNFFTPSVNETRNALLSVKSSMDLPWSFSYLLDPQDRFVYFGKGFKLLGKLVGLNIDSWINLHLERVMVDPHYGLRQRIVGEDFIGTIKPVLIRAFVLKKFVSLEPWFQDLLRDLNTFPEFNDAWNNIQNFNQGLYDEETRKLEFDVLGMKLAAKYSFIPLLTDSRFTFVEYSFFKMPQQIAKYIKKSN